nr:transposase [Butyrivibrio hungatei]
MSYNRYPKEMKEAIVARLLEEDVVVMDIQKETGVGINTLYRWRDACINANDSTKEANSKSSKEHREERKKNERLEKELARKEKALTETAALLVLRKKANAIWGTEDEAE